MSKMGKVLFIVHDVYQDDNEFPLGVGYLAAVLRQQGADVTVCCQDIYHYRNEELAEKYLKNQTWDVIGIGFLAARFKETIIDLCKTVNQHKKNAKLVLGGHGPSPIPEFVLQTTQADVVILGEAEETIGDLLQAVVNGESYQDIKGIAYRDGDQIVVNDRRKPVRHLDELPFPAWDLFPMDIYTSNMQYMGQDPNEKAIQLITSRGCVNKCTFCYRLEPGIRFRSLDNVVQEMKALYDTYGVTYFVIQDELFVASVKRFEKFIDTLENYGLLHKIKYNISVGIRADVATEEMAELLKETGCVYVNIGFESVSQQCLDDYRKNTTVEQNYATAELMRKYEISMGINFIWGIWSDSEQTLKDNVAFIKKYNRYDELRTIRPVTPYPGSELYYQAIDHGLLKGPSDFFNKFRNSDLLTVNFTKYSEKEFYTLLFQANKELILDHYRHTGDRKAAEKMIADFRNLYFKGYVQFRGARHFEKNPISSH